MPSLIQSLASIFRHRESPLSIPILDGSLKPNNMLEDATVFAEREGLEDLAIGPDGELYAACGKMVLQLSSDGIFSFIAALDRTATALAIFSDGTMAVGQGTAVELRAGNHVLRTIDRLPSGPLNSVNALHVANNDCLLISDGSALRPYEQWSHDLMEKGMSGRLLKHDLKSGKTSELASGLAYAFGAYSDASGRSLVSQSWKHQLDAVGNGTTQAVLPSLPGYPARMAKADGGGFWLCVFACRTQLVEFVLQEDDYRNEMMRTIDPRYWVVPALNSGKDFLEPLQGGGVKQMGILKPWAPPRSYGLVVRVGADFVPQFSLHSRVGGRHHGIVSVVQRGDDLFVLSKGAGRILRLSVSALSDQAGASERMDK